jgi:hypothetical protein
MTEVHRPVALIMPRSVGTRLVDSGLTVDGNAMEPTMPAFALASLSVAMILALFNGRETVATWSVGIFGLVEGKA